MGAYLGGGEEQVNISVMVTFNRKRLPMKNKVLPHDDGNQAHDCFIEAVEEIPQELALLLHVANN